MLGYRGWDLHPFGTSETREFNRLINCYGAPEAIRLDYGPEMVSLVFTEWAAARGIVVRYIQLGKPTQNAFIERFNRTYRTEVLDAHLFATLLQVQTLLRKGWSIATDTTHMNRWEASRRCGLCHG